MPCAHSKPTGTPFTSASAEQIDLWSREVFDALRNWAEAHGGRWTRYAPGYLLLEIDELHGEEIDPVLMDTSDEELTVHFGYWEMDLPDRESDAVGAAREAIELASRWLSGAIKTAVFTGPDGKWCGTRIIEEGDAAPPHPGDGIGYFHPTNVEVRGRWPSEWRSYAIGEG